ncbi:M23 family metallopeptidase [Chloroflexota bacterium]
MSGTIYVPNNHPNNFKIHYFDNGDPSRRQELQAQWVFFNRRDPTTGLTFDMLARPSNHHIEVAVDYMPPPDTSPGRYHIEVFVPGENATTRRAVYTIAHQVEEDGQGGGRLSDAMVLVDMHDQNDAWYSLGDFELDKSLHPEIGRVRQYDLTREDPPTQVAFGPVRWVPVLPAEEQGVRFDSPVGPESERNGPFPTGRVLFRKYPVWAGDWFDINPFLSWYIFGCHTGSDLNLPGISSVDKGKPVYAIGDGIVTYAGLAGTWGNIVVVEHPDALVTLPDGQVRRQPVHSRYGHVDDRILVRAGEAITRGQQVGYIGLAAGVTAGWHLHFDISYSGILKHRPAHWPDKRNSRESKKQDVLRHYVDPFRFLRDNHIVGT